MAWRNLANELGFEFTEEQNERFKGVSRVRSLEILLEIGPEEEEEEYTTAFIETSLVERESTKEVIRR